MKRYALVGTGGRGYQMYAKALTERFGDTARLVGLCDPNTKRCAYVRDHLPGAPIPIFTDFQSMIEQAKPDTVIITTVDRYHHEYVEKALSMGCGVICEKPMAIDAEKCQAVLDAEKKFGRNIAVTFNCRFMPVFERLKECILRGDAGEILSIDFEWFLDTSHGADYFRRWHSKLENSGGLLVHKATHHFDIVNWLLDQDPVEVFARGARRFYGAEGLGGKPGANRCRDCEAGCPYRFRNENDPVDRGLYFDAEGEDGYYRDRCIFSDEINIYDTVSLSVLYSKNTFLTYSLIAHSPYEGWRMTISGDQGRIEASDIFSGPDASGSAVQIMFYNRVGERITRESPKLQGMHGGGDERMLRMLLRGDIPDPLGQCAGSREGAMSAMIGIAANKSIQDGKPVRIPNLIHLNER